MYGSVYMPGDMDDCDNFYDNSRMFLNGPEGIVGNNIEAE